MLLITKDDEVLDVPVFSSICGTRIKAVVFFAEDFKGAFASQTSADAFVSHFTESIATKFPPPDTHSFVVKEKIKEAFSDGIVAQAIKKEREACAKLAESFKWFEVNDCGSDEANTHIAKLIRERQ